MGPLTAPELVIGGVLVVTALAFTRCAVAELVIRLAVRLYAPPGPRRDVQREIWLDAVEQLESKERPSHAGTLLWAGVSGFGSRSLVDVRMRLELMRFANGLASLAALIEPVSCPLTKPGRLHRWRALVHSGLAKSLTVPLTWHVIAAPDEYKLYAVNSPEEFCTFSVRYVDTVKKLVRISDRFERLT